MGNIKKALSVAIIIVWCLSMTSCNNQATFQEDWYLTHKYYKSDDGNGYLLLQEVVDGVFSVITDGYGVGTIDSQNYKDNSDGSYTYHVTPPPAKDLYLTYYANSNDIELISENVGSRSRYYAVSEEEYNNLDSQYKPNESVENTEKYISQVANGNRISTCVEYAYTDVDYGYRNIYVVCSISNRTSDTLTFNANDMFELDNHGIIVDGSSDYDYQKLGGSGYSYNITIVFRCPKNASYDISTMSMMADGVKINLDTPNDSTSKGKFEGAYYSGTSCVYIKNMFDRTYKIIDIIHFTSDASDSPYIDVYDAKLDSKNNFLIGRALYHWDQNNYSIGYPDGSNTPYYKR